MKQPILFALSLSLIFQSQLHCMIPSTLKSRDSFNDEVTEFSPLIKRTEIIAGPLKNYEEEQTIQLEDSIALLKLRIIRERYELEALTLSLEEERNKLQESQKNLFEKKMFFLGLSQMLYYWPRFLIDLTQMGTVSSSTRGTAVLNMMSNFMLGIGSILFTQENSAFQSDSDSEMYPLPIINRSHSESEEQPLPENDLV